MKTPRVTVIVPTYNSSRTIEACLRSISTQSYPSIELIVVDNNSTDDTKKIAQKYTKNVFNKGPERNAQRNFGLSQSHGEFVVSIDSDMKLSTHVISDCVEKMQKESDLVGLYIPEESFGEGFWAQCIKLERSFYIGQDGIEAARFFRKSVLDSVRGFDEELISAEDWYLTEQVAQKGKLGRVKSLIYHDEGSPTFKKLVSKKYYYASKMRFYLNKSDSGGASGQAGNVIQRYVLFLSDPIKLFRNPFIGIGMLFLKTSEYAMGFIGFLLSKLQSDNQTR